MDTSDTGEFLANEPSSVHDSDTDEASESSSEDAMVLSYFDAKRQSDKIELEHVSPKELYANERNYPLPRRLNGNEPAVLISRDGSEVAPLLTLLFGSNAVCQALLVTAKDTVVDMGYNSNWWRGVYTEVPGVDPGTENSVIVELQRLCVFSTGASERAFAFYDSLKQVLKITAVDDIEDILNRLGGVTPLKPVLNSEILADAKSQEICRITVDCKRRQTLLSATDELFHGEDNDVFFEKIAPVVFLEILESITLSEQWYPQRYTKQYLPYLEMCQRLQSMTRQKIQEKRKAKHDLMIDSGMQVSSFLKTTEETLRKLDEHEAADDLSQIMVGLKDQIAQLEKEIADLGTRLEAISQGTLPPDLDKSGDLPKIDFKPYNLIGLIVSNSEYYIKRNECWFIIVRHKAYPIPWDQVLHAAQRTDKSLALYARAEDDIYQPYKPFATVFQTFVEKDIAALNQSLQELSNSEDMESASEATSESQNSSKSYETSEEQEEEEDEDEIENEATFHHVDNPVTSL